MSEHDFIAALRLRGPREIHPMARVIIAEWLDDMQRAAETGDTREVHRLVRMVRDKIADELRWEAVKYATVHDHKEANKLRYRATRFEHA
jgi:hypothetical protein